MSQNPALANVQVCTVTGCSLNPPSDELWLYEPGAPTVNSVTPDSGPAAGGTAVRLAANDPPARLAAGDTVQFVPEDA